MIRDYLSKALPVDQPPVTAEQLPTGQQIAQAVIEADQVHQSTNMISLTPEERPKIGPASTPHEIDMDRLYAEITTEHPVLLKLCGEQDGAMSDGYEMETALLFYDQANTNVLKVCRGAVIISAAALTEDNDKIEEAADQLSGSPELPADRSALIGNAVQTVDRLRADRQDAQQQRQRRQQLRQQKHDQKLQQTQQRTTQTQVLQDLAARPLSTLGPGTK